ncbi:hypothetical protein HPB48_005616 [Haemaphysalis longicornis]|uniref:Uncharacterized protein n=1 Tax=Haemaphysalis longicornis TaxID=44386 RepID=A0A9J6GIA1_HAELO|nr:hypothetical protein HPB48_005616 [Haemaphysalis longicornis]
MRLVWQRASREGHLSCQRLRLPEVREKGPFLNRLPLSKCSSEHRAGARFPGPHGDDGFIQVGSLSPRRVTDPGLQNRHGSGRDCYPGATISTALQARRSDFPRPEASGSRLKDSAHLATGKASFQAQRPRKRGKSLHLTWSTHSPTRKTSHHHQPWFVPVSEQCVGTTYTVRADQAELQRMCLETFSELIRERYLSPEEMSYTYGYNQPSKQDIEHRPPEYIADPILLWLSTPPWTPRGGPLLPSRQATPERWKFPQHPPAASVPQPAQRPHHPRGSRADRGSRGTIAGRRAIRGTAISPTTGVNRCSNLRSPGCLTASSFEPPARWSGHPRRIRRRCWKIVKRPVPPRFSVGRRSCPGRLENSEDARATVRGASIAQQRRPSEQQHRPSRMRQFSDYTPSNESLSASTEVLLSDPQRRLRSSSEEPLAEKAATTQAEATAFTRATRTKSGSTPSPYHRCGRSGRAGTVQRRARPERRLHRTPRSNLP